MKLIMENWRSFLQERNLPTRVSKIFPSYGVGYGYTKSVNQMSIL